MKWYETTCKKLKIKLFHIIKYNYNKMLKEFYYDSMYECMYIWVKKQCLNNKRLQWEILEQ